MGSPRIFNPWGERSTPEYLLPKPRFGTRIRVVPATVGGKKKSSLIALSLFVFSHLSLLSSAVICLLVCA